MSNLIVSIGYGKENWKDHGVSMASFIVTPGWERGFPTKLRKRRGVTQTFPASTCPEINGSLFLDTVEANPGDVFLVQASRTWKGAKSADSAMFFRVRENGPLVNLHVKLLPNIDRLNGYSHLVFSGKADRLEEDDLFELGFKVPDSWLDAFTQPDEIKEMMEFETLSPGTPKPSFTRVRNEKGEEKVITVERSLRRIRIR